MLKLMHCLCIYINNSNRNYSPAKFVDVKHFKTLAVLCGLLSSKPQQCFLNVICVTDEVIRKRLLIDGDGAGDDRRINVLMKSFTKWCHSNFSPEEG